ncbi:MAG: biotin--[acetyl-CoA-carboxylase] ligase [Chloroflexota bacterium]|nr:biotin--[acetyl-CoA-carboxylase] ligase [Chloroflexota bacterium]
MVNETRGKILQALRDSSDHVSGEMLSQKLSISRVSVWKHIHGLQQEGYVIEASPKGYLLISSPDLLLPYEFPGWERKIHHFAALDSTMDVARELAKGGAEEGTIVIAEAQSQGRGRLSREWISPEGGIYFTIILRPQISPVHAPRINLMASVAVAKNIKKLLGLKAELKWPNDVLIKGKKVCGILAEMDAEIDKVNSINIGIGINVNSLPPEYEGQATSLRKELGREIPRNSFFSSLLMEIGEQQALLTQADLLEEWKSLSATLNKNVRIVSPDEEIAGEAIDIDANGTLIVKTKDGSLRNIFTGDCVHVR